MVTTGTVHVFAHIFESEAAQADLRRRRHQRRRPPGDRHRRSTAALLLLALVSLSLGLINLLPILPLDGGHIFWAWSRNCAAKPVSLRVMERATRRSASRWS